MAEWSDEERDVYRWRYWEARRAGLDPFEAQEFASSTGDLEQLRVMAEKGATPKQILAVVL